MKNIIINLKNFIQSLSRKNQRQLLSLAILVVFLITSLASIGIAHAKNVNESTVVFDKTQAFPLYLAEKKTEIKPGLAKADMDKLNNEKDPEAIKAYIQEKANEYNIDWKLVYAIGAYESGYFKSSLAQSQNNFFGRKATSTTWMSWETPQQGIDNQFEYLKTRYFDRGMDTPAEMNRVYCEGNTWQYKVQAIMNEA